jgi:hypothetical protein
MKTHVTFRCGRFTPSADDASKPNPELFGKRLADFLATQLRNKGCEPHGPSPRIGDG